MTFGLTPAGFNKKRLADVKVDLQNAFIGQFGDINTDPQSVIGQEIGIFSKAFADFWENLEDVYFSQYPNSASGVALDNVVQLNGITRLPETQTLVYASCTGPEGTYIPQNAQARIDETNEVFYASDGGTISRQNADIVQISADNPPVAQPYTVIISNQSYTYERPTIVFSNVGAIFVTGNVIKITINGIALANIPFNTSSNQTLTDIDNAILALPSVSSTTKTNPGSIAIFNVLGFNTQVTNIVVTGGATQASYTITYTAPPSMNAISERLSALINQAGESYSSVDNTGGTFTVTANSPAVPFSINVGTSLNVVSTSSPIVFLAVNYGPIPCPIGTLTTILTPIAGWNSIYNYEDGAIGRLIETDAELRIRRANSIRLFGAATVESIRARIQQQVPGVTSALVFENRTLYQADILIVFPTAFSVGDTISVVYNTAGNISVPYNTSQAQTMDDLCAAFLLLPQVLTATHGGTGDQTVTLEMNVLTVLTINSATTNVSTQVAAIKGGRPPKSFEAVVQGGTDEAVAEKIWETKPAGIETFGNTDFTIIDSQGNSQVIYFSRPSSIYIWVQVALTLYTEETFPVNGVQLVAANINSYGNSLGVGIDVLFQRVLAQIFAVPGIASGSMSIAATNLSTDTPSYGTADIPIQENEISIFDLDRIFVTVV